MPTLQLAVMREYFEDMKAGVKLFEFRLRTEYWHKRLVDRSYDTLIITLGYPAKTDLSRRLVMPYNGYEEQTIMHPFFGDEPVDIFAIKITQDGSLCQTT
jgi:hypothetical protein